MEMDSMQIAAQNDSNELELRSESPRTLRPSEVPTIPAPRQETEDTARVLLAAYRRESARLTRLAATLKELGVDPQSAWEPVGG